MLPDERLRELLQSADEAVAPNPAFIDELRLKLERERARRPRPGSLGGRARLLARRPALRLGLAAAAAITILVVGNIVPRPVGPAASPSPSPTLVEPSPSPNASDSPAPSPSEPTVGGVPFGTFVNELGMHHTTTFRPAITLTMPTGWQSYHEDSELFAIRHGNVILGFIHGAAPVDAGKAFTAIGLVKPPANIAEVSRAVVLGTARAVCIDPVVGGGTLFIDAGLRAYDPARTDRVAACKMAVNGHVFTVITFGPPAEFDPLYEPGVLDGILSTFGVTEATSPSFMECDLTGSVAHPCPAIRAQSPMTEAEAGLAGAIPDDVLRVEGALACRRGSLGAAVAAIECALGSGSAGATVRYAVYADDTAASAAYSASVATIVDGGTDCAARVPSEGEWSDPPGTVTGRIGCVQSGQPGEGILISWSTPLDRTVGQLVGRPGATAGAVRAVWESVRLEARIPPPAPTPAP